MNQQQRIKISGLSSANLFYRFRGLMWSFPIVTGALGIWQIKRLLWKNKLIATIKQGMTQQQISIDSEYVKNMLFICNIFKVILT